MQTNASDKKKNVKFQDPIEEEEDEIDETGEELNRRFNKFQLLDADSDEVDNGSADDVQNSNEESDGGHEGASGSGPKAAASSQTTEKKSSKRRRNKSKASKNEDIDDLIQMYGAGEGASTSKDESSQPSIDPRIKLLKLDMRNLIPEAELKRMFGKIVLKEDKSKEQKSKYNAIYGQFRSRFVTDSQDARIIAALSIPGPKMELDDVFNVQEQWKVGSINTNKLKKEDQSNLSETISDKKPTSKRANKHNKGSVVKSETPTYFKFVHDKNYQSAQMFFLEAAQIGNSDAIINNLNSYPVHIESLVQLSDMIRVTEDFKAASEFVERALLIFEKGFHVKFNPAAANCRLSYKRPENRTFFITIFKHIYYCNRRGLRRTPLEYTKLLLALDPETDPLFATLMIDFYAIRSEEYDYLIEFAEKWTNMAKLPNINFSLALAHFMKSKNLKFGKAVCESSAQLADELLKKALLRFPNFIISLLEACSAEPDSELKKCDYFDYSVYGTRYKTVPEAVELLVALYVERTSMLWKQKHVLSWLESIVANLVQQFATKELKDEGLNYKHWNVFQGPSPRNLLRHIALSDMKLKVPASSTQASFLDIDPYPPESLPSYTSHATQLGGANTSNSSSSSTSSPGFPGLFLRSILPSFSLTNNEQTNNSNNNNNNNRPS